MCIPAKVKRLIAVMARRELKKDKEVLSRYLKPRLAKKDDLGRLRILEARGFVLLEPHFSKSKDDIVYKVFLRREGRITLGPQLRFSRPE